MPTIRRFEDIQAWQKARELDKAISQTISANRKLKSDRNLCDQLDRAAGSVPTNIAEGFARSGNREFRQYLSQAKASAVEVKAHLYRALDKEFLTVEAHKALYDLADVTEKLIGGFIRYLNKSAYTGAKLKKDRSTK